MVEIKDLTVENIQDEAGFCFQQLNPAAPYSKGDEERYLEGKKERELVEHYSMPVLKIQENSRRKV